MKKLFKLHGKKSSRYSIALVLSLIFHSLLLSYFLYKPVSDIATYVHQAPPLHSLDLTKVKFISPKDLKKIKEDRKSRQIVANELTGKNERPKDSRFAGEKDQTFDRQTMAQINGAFKEAGKGENAHKIPTKSKLSQKLPPVKKLNLSDLGSFTINQVEEKPEPIIAQNKDGRENGKEGVTGPAANNDFVEDVALGDVTNLNTTEFKYYGFYHRIRQKLEQYWGNSIQEKAKKLYKSGRRLPASDNMITAITVILDDHGAIVDIKVDGTSGVRELDQAAIESFNKAGPFPNPPKGLLVDGRATIQWGFVVKS